MTTKIIEGNWYNGEFKYNVQVLYNGTYSGNGKFCKTREEAEEYIKTIKAIKEANK